MWTIASAIVFVPRDKRLLVIRRCQSTRVGQFFVWPWWKVSLETRVPQSTRLSSCLRMAKLALVRNFGVEGGFTPGDLGLEGSTVTRGVTRDSITESPISSDMIGEVALDIEPAIRRDSMTEVPIET